MATNGARDWADDDDDNVEVVATSLPADETIQNRDGTKTTITYKHNEKGQTVKVTRRIRTTTIRTVVNPRVAERKKWAKFGLSANDPPGPAPDTTSVGENIIFRPSANWKQDAAKEEQDPNAQAMKDKLRSSKVKCRICSGEHFTARCPYKDTMAPAGDADVAAGMGDDLAAGGASKAGESAGAAGAKGSYVPPALRNKGAGGGEGEKMGGKYSDRDDLATLRVTNVSEMAEEQELRDMFERFGRVTRVFLAKDRETGRAKGFAFISFADREDAVKACSKMDGFGFKHLILKVEFAKKTAG
ncbi:unnamed protein product [Discula destructiva]